MTATVNTDASFSQRHQLGTFAYWIKSETVRIQHTGVLRGKITDSLEAEIKCIANGLAHLLGNKGVAGISQIVVNTDCVGAIHAIKHASNANATTPAKTAALWVKRLTDRSKIPIRYKHVKGHVYKAGNHKYNTPRHYVNHWCDTQAGEQLTKAISERTNSLTLTNSKL